MYSILLMATMPIFAEQSPPPLARAGCQGAAATSYVVLAQSAGCTGSAARRAPVRTAAANHRNRVASRQAARQSRVRVNVVHPAAVAVYTAPRVRYVAPAAVRVRPVSVVCPNGVCPTR